MSKQEELAISRAHLAELLKDGVVERYARGIYTSSDKFEDEMQLLQLRFGRAIYSHETALFLHGLCDRSPLRFSVTVPSGYNISIFNQVKECFKHVSFMLKHNTIFKVSGNFLRCCQTHMCGRNN